VNFTQPQYFDTKYLDNQVEEFCVSDTKLCKSHGEDSCNVIFVGLLLSQNDDMRERSMQALRNAPLTLQALHV